MKTNIAVAALVLGAVLAPAAAYSADMAADKAATKQYVKDSVITTKVKAKLAEDKVASLVKIKVDTDAQGVVYLSGTTKTQADADRAVTITKAVEGVTSVTSNIAVKG
jgi:hyperosmotically inducible protein